MMACNVSHVDETTPMAPAAGLDDGAIHLVFTRLRPGFLARVDLIDGFLKLDGGKHIHKRSFQSHRCRALRLVPAADDDSRTGLDGEAVPSGAIQAKIFPGALRVFCAAPLAAAPPPGAARVQRPVLHVPVRREIQAVFGRARHERDDGEDQEQGHGRHDRALHQ